MILQTIVPILNHYNIIHIIWKTIFFLPTFFSPHYLYIPSIWSARVFICQAKFSWTGLYHIPTYNSPQNNIKKKVCMHRSFLLLCCKKKKILVENTLCIHSGDKVFSSLHCVLKRALSAVVWVCVVFVMSYV